MKTQGQGRGTEEKLRGIEAALTVSLKVSKSPRVAHWPYWHIDLNSGCGFNKEVNVIGSPLAFLGAAEKVGREDFLAFFVDRDAAAIEELERHYLAPLNDARCMALAWDNREALPVIGDYIAAKEASRYAVGSLIVDPNGYFGDGIPHDELIAFAARFPRIDLIFNLNVFTYQMGKRHRELGAAGWTGKFWPSPLDFPSIFNRPNWLISQIRRPPGHSFCLLIGRSMKTGDHRATKLYHMDSLDGERILSEWESEAHDPLQGSLFQALSDVS